MTSKSSRRQCLGTVIALMLSLPALAMPPKRITAAEKALLPPYCKFTQGGYLGSETTQRYASGATRWIDASAALGGQLPICGACIICYALIHA
jgi:hypothetical protein